MNLRIFTQTCTLTVLTAALCTVQTATAQVLTYAGGGPDEKPTVGGTDGASCGGTQLTQSTDPNTIAAGTVRCGAGTPAIPVDNFYARSFQITQDTLINCVDFAVRSNSGTAPSPSNPWPVRIRLYRDPNGGAPDTAALQLIPRSQAFVTIPVFATTGQQFFTVNYNPPIYVQAGTTLVVEQFQACRQTDCTNNPAGFANGDGSSGLVMGSNNLGESAPTYIKAPDCGGMFVDYQTMAAAGFPTVMHIINLGTVAGNDCQVPLPACKGDVFPTNGNGIVNIDDLIQGVISHWGQTGPPRPQGDCAPGALGNCLVNIDDLLQVITDWGVCPNAGACCVGTSCSQLSAAGCAAAGGTFSGAGTSCSPNPCPPPPANDLCANRIPVVNGMNNWNNALANTDGPTVPTSCSAAPGMTRDVWFNYTATCTGHVTFDTLGTVHPFTDTVLQVFDGNGCSPLGTLLGCNDDANTTTFLSSVTVDLVAGQVVKVRAGSWGTNSFNQGPAKLNIACATLDNDVCADATTLSIPQTVNGSIIGATQDAAPLCNGVATGIGRWYKLVGNGRNLRASTCASPVESWDGRLSVYCVDPINLCNRLTCVAASGTFDCDPSGQTQFGLQERVDWCAVNGQTYYILVHTDALPLPPEGSYTLAITDLGTNCTSALVCGNPPPANDECAGAFTVNDGTNNITTANCTNSNPNTLIAMCGTTTDQFINKDGWFNYTATTTSANWSFDLCSTTPNLDTSMQILTGACGSLTPVACDDDACTAGGPSRIVMSVTAGTVYRLRIGGWSSSAVTGGDSGPMTLIIGPAAPPPTNDECTGATAISCGGTVTITPTQMTAYSQNATDPRPACESLCGGGAQCQFPWTWWYTVTTGPATTSMTLSYCTSTGGPNRDTLMSVYSGPCGALGTEIACDDDFCSSPAFGPSQAVVPVSPNTTYRILTKVYPGEPAFTAILTVTCSP